MVSDHLVYPHGGRVEHLNGLQPGEKVNTALMLQRVSEAGICLLSGVRENLTVVPVDFDLSNYLVSNIVQLSKEIADEHHRTFSYELSFKHFTIEFESSHGFVAYNKDLLELLTVDLSMPEFLQKPELIVDTETVLYGAWEWLTNKHIKGLQKLRMGTDMLNRYSYQSWVFRELARNQESKLVMIK